MQKILSSVLLAAVLTGGFLVARPAQAQVDVRVRPPTVRVRPPTVRLAVPGVRLRVGPERRGWRHRRDWHAANRWERRQARREYGREYRRDRWRAERRWDRR